MAGTDGPEVEAGAASRVIFFSDAVVATLYVVIQVIASGCLVLMSRAAVCGGLLQPDAPRGGPPPG